MESWPGSLQCLVRSVIGPVIVYLRGSPQESRRGRPRSSRARTGGQAPRTRPSQLAEENKPAGASGSRKPRIESCAASISRINQKLAKMIERAALADLARRLDRQGRQRTTQTAVAGSADTAITVVADSRDRPQTRRLGPEMPDRVRRRSIGPPTSPGPPSRRRSATRARARPDPWSSA